MKTLPLPRPKTLKLSYLRMTPIQTSFYVKAARIRNFNGIHFKMDFKLKSFLNNKGIVFTPTSPFTCEGKACGMYSTQCIYPQEYAVKAHPKVWKPLQHDWTCDSVISQQELAVALKNDPLRHLFGEVTSSCLDSLIYPSEEYLDSVATIVWALGLLTGAAVVLLCLS